MGEKTFGRKTYKKGTKCLKFLTCYSNKKHFVAKIL